MTEIFLGGPAVENCNRTKKLGVFVPPPPKIANDGSIVQEYVDPAVGET